MIEKSIIVVQGVLSSLLLLSLIFDKLNIMGRSMIFTLFVINTIILYIRVAVKKIKNENNEVVARPFIITCFVYYSVAILLAIFITGNGVAERVEDGGEDTPSTTLSSPEEILRMRKQEAKSAAERMLQQIGVRHDPYDDQGIDIL